MTDPAAHAHESTPTPTETDWFAAREFWEREWTDQPGAWRQLDSDRQETLARTFARHRERQLGLGRDGIQLHQESVGLVERFARALAGKLAAAERKYGRTTDWKTQDWEGEARHKLLEHVAKGDPLDVAAYAAFIWARGWRTANPAVTIDVVGPDDMVEAIRIIGGLLDCGFQPAIVQRARRWLGKAEAGALTDAGDLRVLTALDRETILYTLREEAGVAAEESVRDGFEALARIVEASGLVAGKCRICGCTEENACHVDQGTQLGPNVCGWADETETLCNAPSCLEAAAGDEGCPKSDPDCFGDNDGCHDACEAPVGDGVYRLGESGDPAKVGTARGCCVSFRGEEHEKTCRSNEAAYFRVNGSFADGDGPCTYHGQTVDEGAG